MPSSESIINNQQAIDIKDAIRSIPTAYPTKNLFFEDQLTEDEQSFAAELADLSSGISHENGQKDRWYDYGDLEKTEFCFDQINFPVSRFSDGSLPVWYGASSHDASKAEVIFHLHRQAQKELNFCSSESSIVFERAVCKATIHVSAAADIRNSVEDSKLFENGPPYPLSNAFAVAIKEKGLTGIVTKSRRFTNADCYALFEKNEVLQSRVVCFWTVEISRDEIKVCQDESFHFIDGWLEPKLTAGD